jgi:hypothetical protein
MAKSRLEVQISDMAGDAIGARVEIDLAPLSGGLGVGGSASQVSVNMGTSTDLVITSIECQGGPGTTYRLLATTPHYRPYSFFQVIRDGASNSAADDVAFWVKPGDVKGIKAPKLSTLPEQARSLIVNASMVREKPQDADLVGLSGDALYANLGPLRQAGLLNILKKASHVTADSCLAFFKELLICRQDRIFATVDASLPGRLRDSENYQSANPSLHTPLSGYRLTGDSFKSRDAHANLQVTFMSRLSDGLLAADIDIDESTGIKHGLEVIKNGLSGSKTNPYLIREFMLAGEPVERTLDPGYRFEF